MDLGVFLRRKTTFWAWLVLPLAGLLVVYHTLDVYCELAEERLERRRAVLGMMPEIEGCLTLAKDVVCGFSVLGGSRGAAIADAGTRTGELARRHGVVINSISVKETAGAKTVASNAVDVEIKSDSSLLALLNFLNELHSPRHLALVRGGTMHLADVDGEPRYEAELIIRCFRDVLEGGPDA